MSTEENARIASGRHAASAARERASRSKTVDSLMTREKFRLAEEVLELQRVNDEVGNRLKRANAEVLRTASELRKRDRALESLRLWESDGGSSRRATRVLELEAENEVYLSEVVRLSSLLRLDTTTGHLPETENTTSLEGNAEITQLRRELAFGAKYLEQAQTPFDANTEAILLRAEERASTTESRIESLTNLTHELTKHQNEAKRELASTRTEAENLKAELEQTKEDREHLKRLAAMEAAKCAEAVEDYLLIQNEINCVRPELDSLRRQISEIANEKTKLKLGMDNAEAREKAALAKIEADKAAEAAANSDRKKSRDKAPEDLKSAMKTPAGFVPRKALTEKPAKNVDTKPKLSAATLKRLSLKSARALEQKTKGTQTPVPKFTDVSVGEDEKEPDNSDESD